MAASSPPNLVPPHPLQYRRQVRRALGEDLGLAGDLTTNALVPAQGIARGRIVARTGGIVAGLPVAECCFQLLDERVELTVEIPDGHEVSAGQTVAVVAGPARAVLTGERVALNYVGHLSGIATATHRMVRAVAEYKAAVVCTRKTTPNLRALEKYAVRAGGGANHRFGLDDAMLIKDNHVQLAGGVQRAVELARRAAGHMVKVEVEVDSLDELAIALSCGVDAVLLDNMDIDTLRRAIAIVAGRAVTEASGGITPENARAVASTGVDLLSVGWLTHSAPALDIGLDVSL